MTSFRRKKAISIWAAIGAPVLGVPLMVWLLALAAPGEAATTDEPDTVVVAERLYQELPGGAPEVVSSVKD